MTILELATTCGNMGCGIINIVNNYGSSVIINDLNDLKESSLARFKVLNWEFVLKSQINDEFILKILV